MYLFLLMLFFESITRMLVDFAKSDTCTQQGALPIYTLFPHRITSTQGIRTRLYNNIYTLKTNNLHQEFTYKYGLHIKIVIQLSPIKLTRLSTTQHLPSFWKNFY